LLTLFIKPALGFTMDTIPEALFNIMNEINEGTDHTIQVGIDEPRLEEAREILSERYDGVVNFITTGSSVVVDVGEEETAEPGDAPVEAEAGHDGINLDNTHEDEAALMEDGAAEIADEEPRQAEEIPQRPREEAQETQEPQVVQEPPPHNIMIGPAEVQETVIENNNNVYSTVAQIVGDESINITKQLDESIRQFNNHFNTATALKRKIEEATQQLSENSPAIINIVDQANRLADEFEPVERVYFTDVEVVIVTHPLVTDDNWDGHRRFIGSMRLGVRLEALFSPNPTKDKGAISIRNLTHRYASNSGRIWECGHIKSNGNSCYGTAFEHIFDAIVSRDLSYITESLIRFIKSPNPEDSWGSHLKFWPVAPTEG